MVSSRRNRISRTRARPFSKTSRTSIQSGSLIGSVAREAGTPSSGPRAWYQDNIGSAHSKRMVGIRLGAKKEAAGRKMRSAASFADKDGLLFGDRVLQRQVVGRQRVVQGRVSGLVARHGGCEA